ncbi:MAG TPA: DNA polymerase III subunit epsilon [Azospirillum sp.]|nr:DNA polymerase III subunit epsilon [Azospirillum sp.]
MGGTWRAVMLGLAVAAMALAYLANELAQRGVDYTALAVMGFGVLALWWAFSRLGRHFRDLDRLCGDLTALRHRRELAGDWETRRDELGRLAAALAELLKRERRGLGLDGDRLGTVAAVLEEPLVLLTETGRIALLNPAAQRLFGAGVAAGTDIYDVIERSDLFRAIERARGAGKPVAARLHTAGGAELPVQVADMGLQAGVALVFPFRPTGHPVLPAVAVQPATAVSAVGEHEPLMALPMVALWVAVAQARVVGIGTVRLSGARIFRTVSLDVLVDPGEPVPASELAAHGIAGLDDARPFAAVWPVIDEALRHCVVVGLGVDAALAALRAERERAGLPDVGEQPALDLGRIAAALDPASAGKDLHGLAARFAVVHHEGPAGGPHALLTAELASVLLRRLDERGVTTFGEAQALGVPRLPAG